MIKYQCKTCLGEYFDTNKDGIKYFHACSQIVDTPAEIDSKTGNIKTQATYKERENKRDENIALDSTGKSIGMKSEGKNRNLIN